MKNRLLKITFVICSILLFVLVAFSLFSSRSTYSVDESNSGYGITVGTDGIMYLNNTYFKGMGLNGFDFVINELGASINDSKYGGYEPGKYEDYFDVFSQYNIPFVRITFGSWWADLYDVFYKDANHEGYFEYTDKIVKEAEEHNVGIVLDFFWYDEGYVYYNQEQRADMGNSQSKTVKNAKEFVKAIINRYKNSPAIWGYEIGNEYNLSVDLYRPNNPPFFTITKDGLGTVEKDFYTTNELVEFYKQIASVIKENDPNRFITTGDAISRDAAYKLYQQTQNIYFNNHTAWNEDFSFGGYDNYKNIIKIQTPKPIDTISFHYYKENLSNGHIGKLGDFSDYLKIYTEIASETGQGLYLGEFGGAVIDKATFDSDIADIYNSSLQLSSVWLAGTDGKIFNESNAEITPYVLQKIKEYNEHYKSVYDSAWDNWKKDINVSIANGSYTITKSNNYTSNSVGSYYLSGDIIKLNVVPNERYKLNEITVTTDKGQSVTVSDNNEFIMPNENVNITINIINEEVLDDDYSLEFDSSLNVDSDNNYIKYLNIGITVSELLGKVNVTGSDTRLVIYTNNEYETFKDETDILASGDILVAYGGDTIKDEYTLSVIGDLNGDGEIGLIDLVQMRKHMAEWIDPNINIIFRKTGVYYYALDMNKDDEIGLIDLVRMRKIIAEMI